MPAFPGLLVDAELLELLPMPPIDAGPTLPDEAVLLPATLAVGALPNTFFAFPPNSLALYSVIYFLDSSDIFGTVFNVFAFS